MIQFMRFFFSTIFLVIFLAPNVNSCAFQIDQLEFNATIGDERSYTYKKLYSQESNDFFLYFADKNGTNFQIPINKGDVFTVQVSEYFSGEIYGRYFLDGVFDISNRTISQFVRQTTDNKSYWENDFYPEYSDRIRREISFYNEFVFFDLEYFNRWSNLTYINKLTIDYKSGWLEYSYHKQVNESTKEIIFESELESRKYVEKSLEFEMQKLLIYIFTDPIIIVIAIIISVVSLRILLIIKKRRKHS